MPTTTSEATQIVQICQEYITTEKLKEMATRLDEEVGQHTDNDSLKVTLNMLRQLTDSAP